MSIAFEPLSPSFLSIMSSNVETFPSYLVPKNTVIGESAEGRARLPRSCSSNALEETWGQVLITYYSRPSLIP